MVTDLGTRLDWLGAVWLTLLAINWAIRWYSKIPGRLISLGGLLIIINGILTLRWPRVFGFILPLEYEYLIRFIIYLIVSYLQWVDWQILRGLTPGEKNQIIAGVELLKLKKKVKKEVKGID